MFKTTREFPKPWWGGFTLGIEAGQVCQHMWLVPRGKPGLKQAHTSGMGEVFSTSTQGPHGGAQCIR